MKTFDESYVLLEEMYEDSYYPDYLVDKIKELMEQLTAFLETEVRDLDKIQIKLDEMTLGINALQNEFDKNGSEIETVARDCIGSTVEYILQWFSVDIETETAIRERDW